MNVISIGRWLLGMLVTVASFILMTTVLYIFTSGVSATESSLATAEILSWEYYMAAALATGLSSIAAGIAVSQVGASAIAALSEKPELFGKVLIILGLSEGIAIYGLIISFVIIAAA